MDFFGILFDMKNGKKVPYSKTYFDTLFAAKLAQLEIKTLTGTLPLTFRTSETALRSWTIYGSNYEHTYSAEGTLPLTFSTHTAGNADDWSISGNNNIGKNLYDYENAELTDWYVNASGDQAFGGGSYYRTQRVSVSPNAQYTISWQDAVQPGTTAPYVRMCYYSGNTFISRSIYSGLTTTGKTVTVTTPSNCDNILLQLDDKTSAQGQYFVNVMLNVGDTSADFEPYQVGVGQRTKNKLEITATTREINGVTFTIDKEAGTITANGTAKSDARLDFITDTMIVNATDVINGIPDNASASTYYILAEFENGANAFGSNLNETEIGTRPNFSQKVINWRIYIKSGITVNNLVFKPMLRAADTDSEFVPYGYEIPLSINSTPQDIYIGSTPLTAGQSVSKTSTGVDIAAIAGSNTITTELYNKPEMAIEGVDYVGVGAVSGDKYLIRVINSANISPYNPNAPESNTSYVYNDSTYTLDTDSQFKTALINWQSGNGNFTITKTKGSTFKLEGLTFLGNWGGEDHYTRTTVITPTGTTYSGSISGSYLLITYYDSEVDTLTPREIRESITVSASVHSSLEPPLLDAPLTEGETLTMEDVGHDFTTFAGVENTIEPFNPEVYDYGDFEMSITYKGG